jgi:hypothetical protein
MRIHVALIALAIAAPAQAELIEAPAGGFVSRHVTEVPASAADAWKALTAPATWWNPEHTYSGDASALYMDAQATGCFCELLPLPKDAPEGTRRGSIEHLQIVYVDPGRQMRLKGGLGPLQAESVNGTLTIGLRQQGGKTRIVWEYVVGGYFRADPEKLAPQVDKVLAEQFDRLAAKLGRVEAAPEAKAEAEAKAEPAKPE